MSLLWLNATSLIFCCPILFRAYQSCWLHNTVPKRLKGCNGDTIRLQVKADQESILKFSLIQKNKALEGVMLCVIGLTNIARFRPSAHVFQCCSCTLTHYWALADCFVSYSVSQLYTPSWIRHTGHFGQMGPSSSMDASCLRAPWWWQLF